MQIKEKLREDVQSYLVKSRHDIVEYHHENNSFYQDFLGQKKISCWEDIPIMTKVDLQQPLEKRLSKDFKIKEVFVNKPVVQVVIPLVLLKTNTRML